MKDRKTEVHPMMRAIRRRDLLQRLAFGCVCFSGGMFLGNLMGVGFVTLPLAMLFSTVGMLLYLYATGKE